MKNKILATISTKDRYDILSLAMQSVANQSLKPDKLIIFDDTDENNRIDLRGIDTYRHIFNLLNVKKIECEVLFGASKGQHYNHQIANRMNYEFVWRLDDDEVAENNVLEKLMSHMKSDVGAVAGAVILPGEEQPGGDNKIVNIFSSPNAQWSTGNEVLSVEHLYSSFLYRAGITNYNLDLSPVAHREETLFTFSLFNKGYKLLVDKSIITWHYRQKTGGIRSANNSWFYYHDDKIFLKKLEEYGYKFCCLDSGLGDHLAFSASALPRLLKKYKKVVIGCCYPQAFEEFNDRVVCIPMHHLKELLPEDHIYKFLIDSNWKPGDGNLVEAYNKLYKVEGIKL